MFFYILILSYILSSSSEEDRFSLKIPVVIHSSLKTNEALLILTGHVPLHKNTILNKTIGCQIFWVKSVCSLLLYIKSTLKLIFKTLRRQISSSRYHLCFTCQVKSTLPFWLVLTVGCIVCLSYSRIHYIGISTVAGGYLERCKVC